MSVAQHPMNNEEQCFRHHKSSLYLGSQNCISSLEFAKILEEAAPKILDIRTKDELAQGFLSNTIVIQFTVFVQELLSGHINLQRDEQIYLVCSNGKRAIITYQILKSKGYDNIFIIEGGMESIVQTDSSLVQQIDRKKNIYKDLRIKIF